jgi:hypothetical protein
VTGVAFPRIGPVSVDVPCLIDTAAASTVIQPRALGMLGPELDSRRYPAELVAGVGGRVEVRRVRTLLTLGRSDAQPLAFTLFVRIPVLDMPPEIPSVLGMDVISMFRLTLSIEERRVEFEPVSRGLTS